MIPIYYFSASGTTKYCAELVQRGFQDKDLSVDLIRIKNVGNLPFPNQNFNFPAIGLAFPVYEFMIPRIILIWLNKLPQAKQKKPVFLIGTSGGMPCNSSGIAMELLKKKNYVPIGVLEIPTPIVEPFFDNKYYPVGWTPEILDKCYYYGVLLAKRLRMEDERFIDLRLGRFRFKFLTKYSYRYFIEGKSTSSGLIKFNPTICTKCGACEKKCPMAAIEISKSPNIINFNRCMFCATCIRTCPVNAIKISYRPNKVPPSEKITPKLLLGYINPKDYKKSGSPHFSRGYLRLLLGMMRVHKNIKARKKRRD